MKKKLLLVMIALVVVPQVTFASWWNPLSWSIFSSFFHSKEQTQIIVNNPTQQEVAKATSTEATSIQKSSSTPLMEETDMTLCNGQYYKKCEIGQLLVCPTDLKVEAYCSIPKTPKVRTDASVTPQKSVTPNTAPSVNTKSTQASVSKTTTSNDVNFAEALLTMYGQRVAELKIGIEESNTNFIPELSRRKSYLTSRISLISSLHLTYTDHDSQIFNQAVDLVIQSHQDEITSIDKTTSVINGNVTGLEQWKSYYEALSSNIRTTSKIVSREEFLSIASAETAKNIDATYNIRKNSYDWMNAYLKKVITKEDEYPVLLQQLSIMLQKMSGSYSSGASIQTVQPVTQYVLPTINLPKQTSCTISGDGGVGLQSYVNCTTY